MDEPLVYRLSRQWHSRVAKFGRDNRWKHLSGKPPSRWVFPWSPLKTTTLIGEEWKHSNVCSGLVLIGWLSWPYNLNCLKKQNRDRKEAEPLKYQMNLFFYQNLIDQKANQRTSFPGDNSDLEPPDPFSNSVVKPFSANDSVGLSMPKSVIARRLFKTPPIHLGGVFYWYSHCKLLLTLLHSRPLKLG